MDERVSERRAPSRTRPVAQVPTTLTGRRSPGLHPMPDTDLLKAHIPPGRRGGSLRPRVQSRYLSQDYGGSCRAEGVAG